MAYGYTPQNNNITSSNNTTSDVTTEPILDTSIPVTTLSGNIYPTRFYYTHGRDFIFEGQPYIGYVNIDKNNIPYKGKNEQIFKLNPIENIHNDNIFDNKYFDTTIFTNLDFSFTLDDILFKPNELINKNSINYKLDKLYDNFKKVYNYTTLSDPLIPDNFPAYITLSSNANTDDPAFGVNTSFQVISTSEQFVSAGSVASDFYPPLSTFDNKFLDAKNTSIEYIRSEKADNLYTMFISISSKLFAFQLNDEHTTFTFQASSSNLGNVLNQITFENISSLATNGKDILYINDANKNYIHKVDVSEIVNEDRTGLRRFNHVDTIGGKGEYDVNLKSNYQIAYGNDSLYCFTPDTNGIKRFTKDLKLVTEYLNDIYFKTHPIQNISYNEFHNQLWVLTTDFNVIILDGTNMTVVDRFEFNANKFSFEIPLIANFREEPRKIVFSTNNSNIYYLFTNKNIYKYYVNKKKELINRFTIDLSFDDAVLWNTIFTEWSATNITWDEVPNFDRFFFVNNPAVSVQDNEKNQETILGFANTRTFKFVEKNDEVSLLSNENPNFYKRSEILLEDEMFNNITYNLALYKHLSNINILLQNLNKKVVAKFNTDQYLFFDDSNELTGAVKSAYSISDPKQFFVGINETLNGNTLNRTITELYNYQKRILELIQVNRVGKRIPALSTVVI